MIEIRSLLILSLILLSILSAYDCSNKLQSSNTLKKSRLLDAYTNVKTKNMSKNQNTNTNTHTSTTPNTSTPNHRY